MWFIMDEGALYGCHNSVLSAARSPTALLKGSSQFIIDHPSSPHLLSSAQDERMGMRRDNKSNTETKRVSGRVWKVAQQLPLKLFISYSIFCLIVDLPCCSHPFSSLTLSLPCGLKLITAWLTRRLTHSVLNISLH